MAAYFFFYKVLSDQSAEDLPNLVGMHQSAFVRGRSLHENFMLVQGTARKPHAPRDPLAMLKLAIMKAFDSVQWPFLIEILQKVGFGGKWVSWICGLLGTTSTRILINGVPGRTIFNFMGLR